MVARRWRAPCISSPAAARAIPPGAERIVYFPELCRAQHGRAARRRRRRHAARHRRAPVRQGRLRASSTRRTWPSFAAASRSRARACTTPPTASRPSWRRRCARRATDGRLPDRVRHQSVRLPHEALSCRAADGAGQHRVHPRHGAAARDARRATATPVAIHPGVQRAQDGHGRQARCASRALQRRRGDGRRRAVLRLRRRQGVQPARAERARAAPPEGCAAAAVHDRLLDQPHLRDRTVRVRGLPLPVDHLPGRCVREPRVETDSEEVQR